MKDKLFLVHTRSTVGSEEQVTKSNLTSDFDKNKFLYNSTYKWVTTTMELPPILTTAMIGNRLFKNYGRESDS